MTVINEIAARVSAAKFRAAEAEDALAVAQEKANALASKIANARARQQAITVARLEGEGTEAEATEFVALTGDIELLTSMHEDANNSLQPLGRVALAANNDVLALTQSLDRANAEATYQAIAARTAEIEALLCKAIASQFAAGQAIGRGPLISNSWRMTAGLDRIVRVNALPEGT